MSALGVESVLRSGSQAQGITSTAMKQRVEQFLGQTAKAAADKNSLVFENIAHKSDDLTTFAANIVNNPTLYSHGGWRFDDHVTREPSGKYTNSSSETGSVYVSALTPLTPQMKSELEQTVYLDQLFPKALTTESNAVAVYFVGAAGDVRYYPNVGLADVLPNDYTPFTDFYYDLAIPKNDPDKTLKWTNVYDDPAGNGLLVTATRPLYKQSAFAGIVAMDITLNAVGDNIKNYAPIESSYAFLVDKGGRAIALPDQAYHDILGRAAKKGEFGADLSKVKGDFGKVLTQMRAGKSGFSEVTAGGTGLDVAYAPVQGTTFSLAIAAKQSVLLKVVGDLKNQVKNSTNQMVYGQVLPLCLGLLLVVWLYGFFYIKRFTDPIKILTSKTAELAGGNFNIEPAVVRVRNEIGTLASSFNTMVMDLRASHAKIEDQNEALLREQSRLKASIKSMPFGFAVVDTNNQILFHNTILAKLFDHAIPDDPAASQSVLASISKSFSGAIDILGCIHQSQDQIKPIEHNVEFGPHFYRFFFMPIIDEASNSKKAIGTVVIMEDTTEKKALERSRDEFFSIASHELRTPLTAIMGNASLMETLYAEQLSKDGDFKQMVLDVEESARRLIALVNVFLDMSRLEQGKIVFKPAPFDIGESVSQILREYDIESVRHSLKLKFEAGTRHLPAVMADPDRTHQILVNLLTNSIKATEAGSVTISTRIDGKVMKISVTDTGKGIPVDGQHLLFRKFQQAASSILTRDNSQSTGLGLYISRLVAEGMGGKLYLERSEVGKGTTFTLELPIAKPATKATDSPKSK